MNIKDRGVPTLGFTNDFAFLTSKTWNYNYLHDVVIENLTFKKNMIIVLFLRLVQKIILGRYFRLNKYVLSLQIKRYY